MTIQPIDIHTHHEQAMKPSVISVEPGYGDFDPERYYSVGIHPWHTAESAESALELLAADAERPEVVAIGETGLDKLRGAPMERQLQLLRLHVELSERLGKPLILHIVRAYPEIIALRRDMRPRQPWIIHGFRGGRQLAEQLLRHGFHLSLGEKFNPEAADVIPADRLHVETDTSALPIEEIASRVESARMGSLDDHAAGECRR